MLGVIYSQHFCKSWLGGGGLQISGQFAASQAEGLRNPLCLLFPAPSNSASPQPSAMRGEHLAAPPSLVEVATGDLTQNLWPQSDPPGVGRGGAQPSSGCGSRDVPEHWLTVFFLPH